MPPKLSRRLKIADNALNLDDGGLVDSSTFITPEGYGFTASADRILRERGGKGFYRAKSTDSVIDVTRAITINPAEHDVALVFDEEHPEEVIGLFTESDYIRFSTARAEQAQNEEESASFLLSPVKEYVTPASDLIVISTMETANVVIAAMKQAGIRHLVVADSSVVTADRKLQQTDAGSSIQGVIRMQDVMSLIQKDERLSLKTLTKKYPTLSKPLDLVTAQLRESANELARDPETVKKDIIKYVSVFLFAGLSLAFTSQIGWLHEHADLAMIGIFILGYVGIIFEEVFEFNKAGVALLMNTGLWITYADYFSTAPGDGKATEGILGQLKEQLADVSDICFFLLAASAIVEVVDAHQGFNVVTDRITTTSKKELFWTIGFLTFFLSAILNNLTVTIVMVSLLRKLVADTNDRRLFGAMVVVAANAGGVWTPIGDVTTTMLWINHQLSTVPTIVELFLPSTVCLVASLAFLVRQVEEDNSLMKDTSQDGKDAALAKKSRSVRGELVFFTGIACLLAVPIFNELTGLPPYLAMVTGLGAIWTLTDILHMGEEEQDYLKVPAALQKLDVAGILFFFGILMSIGVLDKSGLLKELAQFLSDTLPSLDIIATVIGIASALIDNVPLVAATMGMYDITDYATDDKLWQLIALCAGTGGSILVIGSASGVALMGLEKVDFLWYLKNVSLGATVGYFAGIAAYLVQYAVMNGGLLQGLLPQVAVAADMAQTTVDTIGTVF